MAKVIITFTDTADGNVTADLNFVGGYNDDSKAHLLADIVTASVTKFVRELKEANRTKESSINSPTGYNH